MILLKTEEQLLEYIERNPEFYIYGAGKVAEDLMKRLDRYQKKWKGIITTEGAEQKNDIGGVVKFSDISQYLSEAKSFVIAATREQLHEEIEDILKRGNVLNIAYVSDRLFFTMARINRLEFKFQTHLVEHCNLNCRGCYHFSSLADEEYLSIDEYSRDVERIGELFCGKISEILLLGGEPLLHPQVTEFFRLTKKYIPSCELKILTNGLLLCNMKEEFWRSVLEYDVQLWVTKYPVKFDYYEAEKKAISCGVTLHYFNKEPVRTLGHQPLSLKGDRDYFKNYLSCYRANECVDLKCGKVFPCIIPAEIKSFNKYFGENLQVCEQDYVDIYEVKNAMELLERLAYPIPFCRYCNRDNVTIFGTIPWDRTTYDIREWTE